MWAKVLLIAGVLAVISVLKWELICSDYLLFKEERRRWLYLKWKNWGEPILVALILALFIRTFFVQAYKIPTGSMRETLIEKDRILVDKISTRFKAPSRGDIIVFEYPVDKKKDFVKRLIAFGGEEVEIKDGEVWIDGLVQKELEKLDSHYYYNREDWDYGKSGQTFEVPENQYFVLGDNSAHSSDSRNWGFVPQKNLKGRAFMIYWPPKRIRMLGDK